MSLHFRIIPEHTWNSWQQIMMIKMEYSLSSRKFPFPLTLTLLFFLHLHPFFRYLKKYFFILSTNDLLVRSVRFFSFSVFFILIILLTFINGTWKYNQNLLVQVFQEANYSLHLNHLLDWKFLACQTFQVKLWINSKENKRSIN